MRRFAPAILLVLALAMLSGRPSAAPDALADGSPRLVERTDVLQGAPAQPTPAHIVVRFKPGAPEGAVRGLNASVGAQVVKGHRLSGVQRLDLSWSGDLESALATYRRSPIVAEAGLAHTAQIVDIPNDPNFGYQWHLRSSDGGMWADAAWDLATNHGQGVVVAVIDTGVAYEDYEGSLGGRPQSFKIAPDLATTPFVAPWDFVNNDAHPNDDHGHGTHVTGTISQDTGNGYGVAGVAYNSSIMPLKAIDYAGSGTEGDIAEAIYYAVDHGADVINMSLGFPGTGAPDANGDVCTEIVGLNAALDYAYNNGVVVVAAAGNDGGSTVLCPAAYPTVISVGATRFDGQVAFYSNRGTALDIAAPGGDPTVDQNGDGYVDGVLQETFCYDSSILLPLNLYGSFCDVFNAGTSMASPHVAGTAALLLGENPSLTPAQVRSYLESTARDGGPAGRDDSYGWGLLDAAGAVAALLGVPKPPPPTVAGLDAPSGLTANAVSSSRINLSWTDNATSETGYKLERSADGVSFIQIGVLPANATSYPNTNLPSSTTFTYRVRAYSGPNYSPYSNIASATTLPTPPAPTNLIATAVSSSRIDLSWTDNATNEAGFRLERSPDGINFSQIAILAANATSYANTNLAADTTYTYRVRAYEGPNNSPFSNSAIATTQAAPGAPSNLVATAVSSSRINLSWTDNATGEAGFKLERSTNGGSFSQIALLAANAISYANTNLPAGTTYTYRVRAYEGPNNSAFSDSATATTQAAPAAPGNLVAAAVSSSRINLSWTDNATSEAGFKLERSPDGVVFSQIALLAANATSYANTNLPASTTYTYRIRAYDGPNNSSFSSVATATTPAAPAAPSNLIATGGSSGRINLSWTDNATSEAGFKLERSPDGVNFSQIALLPANTTAYSNGGLAPGTTYYFRVRAYDGPNNSAYSNTASATAPN